MGAGRDAARSSSAPSIAEAGPSTSGAQTRGAADRVLVDRTNTLEAPIPLEKLPSLGSAQHSTGNCKRCCFFPRNRCTNGYDCEFCHYDHEKRTHRKRKAKTKGDRPGIDVELDEPSENVPP